MLTLALGKAQQPAYSQDLEPVSPAAPLTSEAPTAPARAPCPTPNPPAPGDKVELYGDEEILLSFRQANDPKGLHNTIINNKVNATELEIWKPELGSSIPPDLANVSWLANTSGDLNGDGRR
jgi:hypothetical protein